MLSLSSFLSEIQSVPLDLVCLRLGCKLCGPVVSVRCIIVLLIHILLPFRWILGWGDSMLLNYSLIDYPLLEHARMHNNPSHSQWWCASILCPRSGFLIHSTWKPLHLRHCSASHVHRPYSHRSHVSLESMQCCQLVMSQVAMFLNAKNPTWPRCE